MKNIFKNILFATVVCLSAKAQQPVAYNLYTINPFLLNPAAMGGNDCINVFLNSHLKWTDLPDAPKAYTFGAHGKLGKNASIGGMLLSDNRSLVSYLTLNGMYAYNVKFNSKQNLSLGLSVGYANNSLNTDKVQTQIKNDPAYQTFNSSRFDVGFGAIYSFNAFKLGASIPRIFDQFGNYSNQFNVNASYDYMTKDKEWKLTPMILARNYNDIGIQYDVVGIATWKEMLTGQLGYRTDKSILAGLGFRWNNLHIAYAYQYNVGSVYNAFSSSGTQEIQLAVRFCKKHKEPAQVAQDVPKPVVKEVDPNADKINVNVNMKDEKYGNPVPGNITIMKGNSIVYKGEGDNSGISNFYLKPGVYQMSVTSKGYIPVEETIDISKNEKGSKYDILLKQPKIEKGLVFKLSAINFETGSDRLTTASFNILDKMAQILIENPQMVVEVSGHTDNVGDDSKNLVLSQNRANAVMNYLLKKEVTPAKLKAVGYGETQPVANNETEEGRKQNRRVMFIVLDF